MNYFTKNKIYLLLAILALLPNFADAKENKSFFWELSDAEGNTTYLLGSIHVGDEDMYPLKKSITDAFSHSDVLAVEINMNEADPTLLLNKALYQSGETLEQHITPEQYASFQEVFEEAGLDKAYYNKFKPWFAALFVTSFDAQSEGFDQSLGIDMHFLELAKERKMPVEELEGIDSQIAVFETLDSVQTSYYINYLMKSYSSDSSSTSDLVDAYKTGDEKLLDSLILGDDLSQDPNLKVFSEKMIIQRNYQMAEKIKSMHQKPSTYFIVAGAAHFVGKDGIISILNKDKNFKILRK